MKPQNPQAFPYPEEVKEDIGGNIMHLQTVYHKGATLRDYFAASVQIPWDTACEFARYDLMSSPNYDIVANGGPTENDVLNKIAEMKMKIADAMLKLREESE